MRSKTRLRAVPLVVSLALMAIPVHAADDGGPSPSPSPSVDDIEWDFVHTADSGSLQSMDDGSYQLVLQGVDDQSVAFTVTPGRQAELLPASEVLEIVASSTDKPNAALQVTQPAPATVVLTLTDGSYDEDSSTLTYDAQLVGDADPAIRGQLSDGGLVAPTLFVDGESTSWDPLEFTVGSTCEITVELNDMADLQGCWKIEPGGENWPPMYSALKVTFKNTGTIDSFVKRCWHKSTLIKVGKTVSLTFDGKSKICGGWGETHGGDTKDPQGNPLRNGEVAKVEIVAIEDGS